MPYPEPECPHCHRALSDCLRTVPSNRMVSVDVPLDILEAEWVSRIGELKVILKYLNENREGRVKLSVEGE